MGPEPSALPALVATALGGLLLVCLVAVWALYLKSRQTSASRLDTDQTPRTDEQKFRFLSQIANEAAVVHKDGLILLANAAYYEMFGYEPTELQDVNAIEKTVPPDCLETVRTRVRNRSEEPYDTWGLRRNGTRFPIRIVGREHVYQNRPVRVTLIRDITGERQAVSERERLIAELETKNEELERFTYSVSHDLKSPLLTIASLCDLLLRDMDEQRLDTARQRAQRLHGAADHMQALLDALLEMSRVGRMAAPHTSVDLRKLLHHTLAVLEGRLRLVKAEVHIDEKLPCVSGQETHLQQVFQNLIDNALRFMGEQKSPRIDITCEQTNPEIVISVSDNGRGIEPHMIGRVFELFVQSDPYSDGTGVGLALVKRILELHGGTATAESPGKGKGTTIKLIFPGNNGHSSRPIATDAPTESDSRNA